MPRRARRDLPSGIYHMASRGTGESAIYVDDIDRKTFLTLLGRAEKAQTPAVA